MKWNISKKYVLMTIFSLTIFIKIKYLWINPRTRINRLLSVLIEIWQNSCSWNIRKKFLKRKAFWTLDKLILNFRYSKPFLYEKCSVNNIFLKKRISYNSKFIIPLLSSFDSNERTSENLITKTTLNTRKNK
jgi:hypothetical protein